MNVSATLNAMFIENPNRDDSEFWSLLKNYIARTANSLVPNPLNEDLTQDVLYQIVCSMGKFAHQPGHNGSSFTRWVSGIVWRRAGDLKRAVYGAREVPASNVSMPELPALNVGTFDGDKWQPVDLSDLASGLNDSEYESALSAETWPALAESALKNTRAALTERDVPLFDEIRKTGLIKPSALSVGLKSGTAYSRLRSWSKLVESPGPRAGSSKQGCPCSTQPGEQLAIACVLKNPAALIIRNEWRFKSPVVRMPAHEFDAIVDRGYTIHSAA